MMNILALYEINNDYNSVSDTNFPNFFLFYNFLLIFK